MKVVTKKRRVVLLGDLDRIGPYLFKSVKPYDTFMQPFAIPAWRRAVIKVGSSLIAPEGRRCSTKHTLAIARFIIESREQGREVVLVSSGAVAAGVSTQPTQHQNGKRSIPEKQALAAIGQALMVASWSRLFDFPCAQLLLTYDDLFTPTRCANAKNTLMQLLAWGTLPIVNENDTVAVEELKVGDNDNLAAHVAALAEADLLIICADVDGLYDANPRLNPNAQLIREVHSVDDTVFALAGDKGSALATGGMRTKLEAAANATAHGINTIILNGTQGVNFEHLLEGYRPGTIFWKQEEVVKE